MVALNYIITITREPSELNIIYIYNNKYYTEYMNRYSRESIPATKYQEDINLKEIGQEGDLRRGEVSRGRM